MRVWYFDIPAGTYTTDEIAKMAKPHQKKCTVYSALRRLGVESYRINKTEVPYNKRNEKLWIWKGPDFYLNLDHKKEINS